MALGPQHRPGQGKPWQKRFDPSRPRKNHEIQSPTVLLIGNGEGTNKTVTLQEALGLARQAGLDLVEIAPAQEARDGRPPRPPVCRITEYGKILYDREKSKNKEKKNLEKELTLHCNINEHDLQTKLRQTREFLEKNHRVTFRLRFRGREKAHKELGYQLLERINTALKENGKSEPIQSREGTLSLRVLPLGKPPTKAKIEGDQQTEPQRIPQAA